MRNGGAFGSLVPTFEVNVDSRYAWLNTGAYLSSNPGMSTGRRRADLLREHAVRQRRELATRRHRNADRSHLNHGILQHADAEMVMRTESPWRSVNVSPGTIPAPVRSTAPEGKAWPSGAGA